MFAKKNGLTPNNYLKLAKSKAEKNGFNPNLLKLSDNADKKLSYNNIDFGSSSNKDYIIYQHLEKQKLINDGESEKHRKNYLSRALKIKGNWKNKPLSKNNLAIKILWGK
jgi:hypothetical protein